MKIEKRTQVADEVLKELRKALKGETRVDGFVSPYINGREAGYVFSICRQILINGVTSDLAFTFSENRNSDDVVVYTGDFQQALFYGEDRADKMYETKRLFPTPMAAAHFIAKQVLGIVNKSFSKKTVAMAR